MEQSKWALITGGSRGLGRDMSLNLAQQGVNILFTYHNNSEKAYEVMEEIKSLGQKAHALQLDTRVIGTFDAFFAETGKILLEETGEDKFDFLINNAGTGMYVPFEQTTEEQFDEMMNIHLKWVYFLTQKALKYMNNGGRIINISSGLARFSIPGSSAYASMKGAIEVFTRYLAKELGERGITANVVAPGAIATDFGGGRTRDNQEIQQRLSGMTALGRVGVAEDIGGIVAFLCSEKARWINGQRIEASGGMML